MNMLKAIGTDVSCYPTCRIGKDIIYSILLNNVFFSCLSNVYSMFTVLSLWAVYVPWNMCEV